MDSHIQKVASKYPATTNRIFGLIATDYVEIKGQERQKHHRCVLLKLCDDK
jgi:hypothetical protein